MLNNDYSQFLYAKKIYKQRKYDDALVIFEKLRSLYPANSSVKFEYARTLIKTGTHISYGESILYNFINNYGGIKFETGSLELARLEIERCNFDKAEKYLTPLLKRQNKDKAMFELAKINELKGNYKMAIEYLKQLVSLNYDLSITYLYLININYKIGAYKEAFAYLNLALENNISLRISLKEVKKLSLLLQYKLGLISEEEILKYKHYYSLSQIVNYSREEAIKHISHHQNFCSFDINDIYQEINRIPFLKELDVAKLYEICCEKIKEEHVYNFDTADEYIIRLDKPIARGNFEYIYTVSVIAISNTKDILTIYPNAGAEELLLRKESGKKKIKK